jgi:hypothetical protein
MPRHDRSQGDPRRHPATLRPRDLVEDCFKAEAERVDNLIAQKAKWNLVEEARDKATFYFESYLDLTILIGRQAQKLGDTKKT